MSLIDSKQFFHGFRQFGSRVRIAHKIGYGYFVAISIGFLGSMTGLVIADYYQGQGVEQLADAQRQSQILDRFLSTSERLQIHSLRLVAVLEDSQQLQVEKAQIRLYLTQIQELRLEMGNFIDSQPTWLAAQPSNLKTLLNDYTISLEVYTEQIESNLKFLDPNSLQQEDIERLREQLLNIMQGQEVIKQEQFHRQLLDIINIAQNQERQGGVAMEDAQGLEKLIIVLSALLSIAIAGIIALRTTSAIAHPLEKITHVAQRVTSESNFHLRVFWVSDDEIGILAKSLNQLIQWISSYTQQLEIARQTLEQRVQERTTELALSNQKLQQTLQELGKTQTQMLQSEKMSSLGQMVAGIAHEINNPVSFVYSNIPPAQTYAQDLLGLLELYQQHYPHPPATIESEIEAIDLDFLSQDFPRLLNSMQVGSERIRDIVNSLRTFSRLDEAQLKPVDVHDGLNSTLMILTHRFKQADHSAEIQVIKKYGQLPLVTCYAGQLHQVFINILSNAIDALEEAMESQQWNLGQVQQASSWVNHDSDIEAQLWVSSPCIQISTEVTEANSVVIKITDNGAGITEKLRSNLFDPFFTTKPVGKGTGLGLSISYQIVVDKHGGKLWCQSLPGQGSQFVIEIPLQPTSSLSNRT